MLFPIKVNIKAAKQFDLKIIVELAVTTNHEHQNKKGCGHAMDNKVFTNSYSKRLCLYTTVGLNQPFVISEISNLS